MNDKKKIVGIFSADWHVNPKVPVCRRDEPDWWQCQLDAIKFVKKQSDKYKCPVFVSGDLLDNYYFSKEQDKTKWNNLIALFKSFTYPINTIIGNHDMQNNIIDTIDSTAYKSLDLVLNCDISNLSIETETYRIDGYSYGTDLSKIECKPTDKIKIAMIHNLAWFNEAPYIGASESGNIKNLYKKLSVYDIVSIGHIHIGFIQKYKDTLFINNGSVMRLKADQIDYKPFVTLLYNDLSYKQIFMPIDKDIISREHIDKDMFKENRLSCYVKYVNEAIKHKDTHGDIFDNLLSDSINNKKIHIETRKLLQEVVDVIA